MRRLLAFLLLACACAGTNASATIKNYATRVDVAADGSARVTVNVQLTGSQPGRIPLPIGFGAMDDFQVKEAPRGVTLKPIAGKEQSIVEIELPDAISDEVKLTFSFSTPDVLGRPKSAPGEKSKLPADTSLLRHSFVNTQETAIGTYQVDVRLPDDVRVHKIGEQLPKLKRAEVLPRVRLDRLDGHQGAVLQLTNIKQGDRTSMSLDVIANNRSLTWLLVGLVLSAGYLFAFRDLVIPGKR